MSPEVKINVPYQYLTAEDCRELKEKIATDLDLYADKILWGEFGQAGKSSLKERSLLDLDTEHLENILITQPHTGCFIRAVIVALLKKRYTQDETISIDFTPPES